jgi:hyperosmotically inducible protein
MKTNKLFALFVLMAAPAALFASPADDRKIEATAKASYNYCTVLDNQVTVTASDGVVTLTGTVQDDGERKLAADTVQNIPSVVSVNNQITIQPTYPEHTDGWIVFKIHCLLLVKANVSAINTKVAVNDGNVILSGIANSLAQKELTKDYVKDVTGVKMVDNEIVVQTPASPAPTVETPGEVVDDASINSQVKYSLLDDKATSALTIKIVTTNGVVRCTGDATSDAQKSLVTKLASEVRGVKSVTNDMTVVPAKA